MKNKTVTSKPAAKPAAKADPKPAAAPSPAAQPAAKADPKPAAKPAAKADPKPAAKPAAAPAEFPLHLNKTGRLCIGAKAAERIGDANFIALKIEGKIVRLVPTDKEIEGAIEIKFADKEYRIRPYVSATKQFKTLGFDGGALEGGLNFVAKPYGAAGLEFQYA